MYHPPCLTLSYQQNLSYIESGSIVIIIEEIGDSERLSEIETVPTTVQSTFVEKAEVQSLKQIIKLVLHKQRPQDSHLVLAAIVTTFVICFWLEVFCTECFARSSHEIYVLVLHVVHSFNGGGVTPLP